jgi:hypothetical protein
MNTDTKIATLEEALKADGIDNIEEALTQSANETTLSTDVIDMRRNEELRIKNALLTKEDRLGEKTHIPLFSEDLDTFADIAPYIEALASGVIKKEGSDAMLDRLFTELLIGAVKDRMSVYGLWPNNYDIVEVGKIQDMRLKADNHIMKIIKICQELRHQPLKVTVKKADNVNFADKFVDKQVTINKK